jgi:hypothetical protein
MEQIFLQHPWIIILIIVWSLPWKAAALWRSARRGHFGWFFAILIINSLAILDILYFFIFSRPKSPRKHDQPEQKNEKEQPKPEAQQAKSPQGPIAVKVMIV